MVGVLQGGACRILPLVVRVACESKSIRTRLRSEWPVELFCRSIAGGCVVPAFQVVFVLSTRDVLAKVCLFAFYGETKVLYALLFGNSSRVWVPFGA